MRFSRRVFIAGLIGLLRGGQSFAKESKPFQRIDEILRDLIIPIVASVKKGAPIIVYSPDHHTGEYQDLQRKRILALDRALPFDAIGLEGIARGTSKQEIQGVMLKLAVETDKLRHCEGPPLLAKLQSLYRKSGQEIALSLSVQKTLNAVASLHFQEKLGTYSPRHNAPGLAYYSLKTQAPKIGMVSRDFEGQTSYINDLLPLLYIENAKLEAKNAIQNRGNVSSSLEKLWQEYSRILRSVEELPFDPKFANFVMQFNTVPEKIEQMLDVHYARTSKEWMQNILTYRCILVIGGSGHSADMLYLAQERNASLILLGDCPSTRNH